MGSGEWSELVHKCCSRQVSTLSGYPIVLRASRGHDNNAKVATQYFSVIRKLERGHSGAGVTGRGR